MSKFYLSKKYQKTDENLSIYADELILNSDELTKHYKYKKTPFNYIQAFKMRDGNPFYKTHSYNIERFWIMNSDDAIIKEFKNNKIGRIEAYWMKQTYNAGLIYSTKGEFNSHGYDKSNFYGSILASDKFMIPIKEGKECILKTLPLTKIKYGFYRVLIVSNDENVRKLFMFSPNHTYTHYSLRHALELQKKYKIDITLIQDDKPNAYIYLYKNLVTSDTLFLKWFQEIKTLKSMYPKNTLLKMLSSSLWGHLSKRNIKSLSADEAEKLNIGLSSECDYYIESYDFDNDKYELHDLNEPYKLNIRLKPFLTSFGRVEMANISIENIDHILRIHTDGICYDKEIITTDPTFIKEEKTTGMMTFPIYRKKIIDLEDEDE
jgi:hypothetical protein